MKIGDKFEHQFLVNDTVYNGFIALFHDRNPLHTDTIFAQSKGFSDKVMHGNILGGFLSYFIGECLPVKNVIIHSQEIKYAKPVYLNQAVLLKAEVADVFESVHAIQFKYHFEEIETETLVAKGKIQIGILA